MCIGNSKFIVIYLVVIPFGTCTEKRAVVEVAVLIRTLMAPSVTASADIVTVKLYILIVNGSARCFICRVPYFETGVTVLGNGIFKDNIFYVYVFICGVRGELCRIRVVVYLLCVAGVDLEAVCITPVLYCVSESVGRTADPSEYAVLYYYVFNITNIYTVMTVTEQLDIIKGYVLNISAVYTAVICCHFNRVKNLTGVALVAS